MHCSCKECFFIILCKTVMFFLPVIQFLNVESFLVYSPFRFTDEVHELLTDPPSDRIFLESAISKSVKERSDSKQAFNVRDRLQATTEI